MVMLLKPLRNKVIVMPVKTPNKTKSGIYIPDSSTEISKYAQVVSIGEKVDGESIKIGAKVMYTSSNPIAVESEDGTMFIIDDNEIIAIIEDSEE